MNVREYNNAVEEWSNGLFRFALGSCKDRPLAEDLVQEAFARLWEKRDTVAAGKVKSYLFTTVHRLIIDGHRKAQNQQKYREQGNFLSHGAPSPPDLQDILHQALDKLPEVQKNVVLLRDYEGYDYNEIGQITGLNESQVKVYIFRARKQLKAYLGSMEMVL